MNSFVKEGSIGDIYRTSRYDRINYLITPLMFVHVEVILDPVVIRFSDTSVVIRTKTQTN